MGKSQVLSSGARVETPLTVRMAGLPAQVLASLRCDRSFAAADEIVTLRASLEARGPVLADALYEVIGGLPEGAPKPELVGLRRALHGVRRPRPTEWSDRCAQAVPGPVAHRIRRWIADLDELNRQTAELPGLLAGEAAARLPDLRDAAAHPRFRRALSQASPALFAELSKWLVEGSHPPRRQSLIRLAKYLARAAAKTSPYSTFTVSGIGEWAEDGPFAGALDEHDIRGVTELDGLLVQVLIRLLCASPRLASSLALRVNPSAAVGDGTVSFVGRLPDEPLVTMSATPAVRECLRVLDGNPGLTLPGLRDLLAARATTPAEDIERFLNGLLDIGVLERRSPVADLSGDPLGELTDWLAACGPGELADIAALTGRVRAEICRDVAVDDVDGHDVRQRRLIQAVAALTARVDGMPDLGGDPGKWVFHENAVVAGAAVPCSIARWRPALADLDVVRHWLAPFDWALPLRLALGTYVGERFGAGATVPILALHRAVQEEMKSDGEQGRTPAAGEVARLFRTRLEFSQPLAHSALPRLRELSRIRRQAREVVLAGAVAAGVVRVAPSKLAVTMAAWPDWVSPPESIGCYVQATGDAEVPSLVLNAVHGGFGRGRSRLAYLIGQAAGAPPAGGFGEPPVEGAMAAEFGGLFASALNLRAPSVPYELDYPFTTSRRPGAQRVPVADLVVVHDPRRDLVRLRSQRWDADVIPLHLGMMADVLLPPVARLLTQAFGRGYYLHPSAPVLAGEEDPAAPDSVVSYPRVEIGKIVLRRACWVAPLAQVPRRASGDRDADYWLRLLRWTRAQGIPARSFVRIWGDGLRRGQGSAAHPQDWVFHKSRKPVYLDLASWYLVAALQRMLHGPASVAVFEEALPAPEATPKPPEDPAVTEFLVEISGCGAGRG